METPPTQTTGILGLLRASLFDEDGKISSSRIQGQQLMALGWVVAIGGLIINALGKDVSTYALGLMGIISGQGASNTWASQRTKVAKATAKKDDPKKRDVLANV